jgi:hypothetical protein
MRRLLLSAAFLVLAVSLFGPVSSTSQAAPQNASDPKAQAVVQAAINAMGGATAIGSLQSWTFQAQAEGRIANGAISEGLALSSSQNSSLPAGTTAKAPPPWAKLRSLFVPALASAILVKQSPDPNFTLKQAAPSYSAPNTAVVAFSVMTKAGSSIPAQRWYFDSTTSLPNRIEFILPAAIGPFEAFAGVVTLSNYKAIGGVLYPLQIVTFLQRERAAETITLQSVTPSTAATPSSTASTGGAQ